MIIGIKIIAAIIVNSKIVEVEYEVSKRGEGRVQYKRQLPLYNLKGIPYSLLEIKETLFEIIKKENCLYTSGDRLNELVGFYTYMV